MLKIKKQILCDRALKLSDLYIKLLGERPETLDLFVKRYPNAQGVYVITDPADDKCVYVGCTISASEGLGQRIHDHIYNQEFSDLNQKLGGDRELTRRHFIRIVEIPDLDDRRFVEHFGIAVLRPVHNR